MRKDGDFLLRLMKLLMNVAQKELGCLRKAKCIRCSSLDAVTVCI